MPSQFAAACAKKGKVWTKANKAKPSKGGNFGPADIPDGNYLAKLSCEYGVSKAKEGKPGGVPWVRITATVDSGRHIGAQPSKYYYLDGKPPTMGAPDTWPTDEEKLAGDLQTLLPHVDIKKTTADQLEALLDELESSNPRARVGIQNSTYKDRNGVDKQGQRMFINDLVDGGKPNGEEEESEEEGSEEGEDAEEEEGEEEELMEDYEDSDSEEEEAEEEDSEEEEDEITVPGKGDTVMFKPPGAKKPREFTVISVNMKANTCQVKDAAGKKVTAAWDKIEVLETA